MLDNNKVKISNILSSLIPDFIEADNPKFKEFLEQYYIFEEREYGTTNIADNLSEYKNIATLSDIETVRAQTIPAPGTLVPPQVVAVTAEVLSFDDTINVTHTKGFPDTYGLLKIDNEIITYTGKTDTSFTGCARGFSGISAIETQGNPEFLTFSETESAEHTAGTVVVNLGFVFLGQFYSKFKGQFLPGVEKRPFASGLAVENILSRAKDFYTSKGTDSSIDLLFKVLYAKDVVIDKPFNNTISVSDAEWQVSDEIMVEALTGNPMNLKLYSLYQGSATDFSTNPTATGAISNVEEVFLGSKTYHRVFLSRDTVENQFNVNNRTKVLEKGITESVVTVDSTVGFGNTGFFWYPNSIGTYTKVEYTSKSYNQFFGCVGIASTSLGKNTPIIGDQFVWGYENNDLTKVCQMRVVGSVVDAPKNEVEGTQFYSAADKIGVKFLGDTIDESDVRFNKWIYNNSIDFDVVIAQVGPGGTQISGIDVNNKIITTIDKHSVKKLSDATIDVFEKFTGKVLDTNVKVTSITDNTIGYYGNGTGGILKNGVPVVGTHYTIRYNLRNVTPSIGLDYLLSDVPNTFVDREENCIAAFSGYPSGDFNTTDRSKTFTSNDFGLVGSGITITNHEFLQGEKVYYQPLTVSTGVIGPNDNRSGIETGIYYVSVVDDDHIKLSLTRQAIFTEDTLWDVTPQSPAVGFPTGSGTDEHKITPYSLYVGGSLKNQNNLKRIRKTPADAKNSKNIVGPVGVAVNGLELHSALSDDSVYYGQIDRINVFSPGKEYNIVDPPNVSVADSVGSGIEASVHLGNGYISDIVLTSSGWDYQDIPSVTITGGNGTNAECEAKMKYVTHSLSFNDSFVDVNLLVGDYGRFNLSKEHKLLQGEAVIYNVDPNGNPVGVGSTNVGLSTSVLTNGGTYYVIKNSNTSFSLALTKERAVAGINTIQFTTDGSGIHKITAKRKRRIVDNVTVKTPGKNFAYNKVDIDSYRYAPSTQVGILTTFTGISTENNYIYARNHNFNHGDVVTYSHNGTTISGLSTASYYKLTVLDRDTFKLSEAGTATSISNHNFDNKIYSDLTTIGVGTHTFTYPDVKVKIEGITAVGIGSTVLPSYLNATAYANLKGSVSNIFIKRGGIGYGSSTIINHIRQPNITLQTGQDARVGCIVDVNGAVVATVINDPGKDYSTPPVLKVIGSGAFAKLKANVVNGKIDSIDIIDGGVKYTPGQTTIEVLPAGSEALFNADIHKWTLNNVQRYSHVLSSAVYQDTVQIKSTTKEKGNKICSFYPQKQLRMDLNDNLNNDKTEKISDLQHSPIIGWAYDGNPIFGPYGKPPGVGVKKMQSSYIIDAVSDSNLRPQYVNGYFVEDYFYDQNSGDLDEYNGRYLTPGESDDFPNGTYGYYASIQDTPTTTPTFPYLPFRHYNDTDEFNYELLRDQSDIYINTGEFKRNVTNYGYNVDNTRYSFHEDPLSSNAILEVEEVKSAGVTTVSMDVAGDKYKVGELVSFSNPSSVSGTIKEIAGKQIETISLSETAVRNLKFQVIEDQVTAFSTVPHNYLDSEIVQISGISSALFNHIEGTRVVGVKTVTTALSVGLANTVNTGLTTFIKLSESTISDRFNVGDVLKLGNEQMRILAKDHYNNRFRVARTQNGTVAVGSGIATGTAVEKVPHEFTYKVKKKVKNKNLKFSRKYNFDGELAVGIGSTVKSTIVGYSGISTIYKSIPQGAIYLPGHQFNTGDQLSYVAYGSTIKYSNTTDLTPEIDLAGIGSIYAIKFNDEFIGITTGTKIGVSTAVGFTTALKYFTVASGHDHRFETIEDNITGESKRVQATVAVSTFTGPHGLSLNDDITFKITPDLTQTYAFKFDDTFNKLVTNHIGFTTNLVGVGIGTTNSLINLTNHGYNTGDQVIYTAANPIAPLVSNTIYHVIKVSDSEIKLAANNYNATNKDPYDHIYFTNSGSGSQQLARIHPPLQFYRGNTVEFDVSDTSLADFDINFYYDEKFESRFESDLIKKPSASEFGNTSASSKITIDVDETFPKILYYKLEGTGPKYTSTYPSSVDTEVPNHSKIKVVESDLNGTHRITGVAATTFTVSLVGSAETTSYTSSGFSTAIYSTTSANARGGVHSLKVVNSLPVDTLPKVVSVATTAGSAAIFSERGDDIGEILNVGVVNQGVEYSSDKTLAPKADAYTILKLKNVYTLESVGIVTGGNNYTSPPVVTSIGNSSILCSASIIGNSVADIEILANDSGLSKDLQMIPTVNSNGVKVISAESNFAVNTLYLRAPVTGFTTFPFKVGDEVYIENVNITDPVDGYNSSDYGNRNFTVIEVNETGGQESIKYSIAGIGSTGGTYDTNNAFGRVVKVDDLAIFQPNLTKVEFVEGERITQDNGVYGYVVKDGWDPNAQTLKIKGNRGKFEPNKKITSSLNNSKSIIQTVHDYDFNLTVDSIAPKSTDWETDKGKLNFDSQRIHDNDYYQRFSYAIKGEVPYETWKEPIRSLGHISGYKPFADYEVLNGLGTKVGFGTASGDVLLNVEMISEASVHDRYYYDFVSDDTPNPNLTKIITFGSKTLTDYSESRSNKVLLLKDIGDQFTGQTRTFTGEHKFIRSDGADKISKVSGGSGQLTATQGTSYDASTGVLTIVTTTPHKLVAGATISMADYSLVFRCDLDGFMTDHAYPRPTDPASTSNSKFNNGILAIGNTTETSFDVTINNPIEGGQIVGLTTFALYTIGDADVLTSVASTERLFYKTVQPGIGVSVDTNTVTINGHSFSNGEPLEYSSNGGTRIGIATATIGAGTTTFLPDKVWAIVSVTDGVLDQKDFKLASSLSNANAGTALTITSIGTGNTHTFSVPSELATTRTVITIDNMIQSPLTSKVAIGISLSQAVGVGTTTLWLQDISKIEGGTLLRLEEEIMKVNTVGVGSTNSLNVDRGVMGTVAVAHTVGAGLTYLTGDYRIKDGNIHFSTPPYGPTGVSSNTTRSTFDGRSFYRLDYQYNTVFDDVSEDFDGQTAKFWLTKDGNEISGIQTNYGMVLVNNIFQDLHYGEGGSSLTDSDYRIVGAGNSIDFTGIATNFDLPKGGIINEYSVFAGVGIQSAYGAVGVASVGAGGTIREVSIGNSGSGYLFAPRVGIAITNYHFTHNFVSASPNCLTAGGGASGTLTPTFATYESTTGDLVLTIPDHTLTTSNTVRITDETLVFTCSRDGFVSEKKYPRSTDPASGQNLAISNANGNTITVNVGTGAGIGASFTASINNGQITGITVTNPGSGYTATYQPILEIDPPSPWRGLPLKGGLGVGASMDVTVGTAGSVINFELSNPGYGYSTGDVLSLDPVPYKVGVTSAPFTITVNNRYQDKFSGWNFGKLLELDDLSYLFNGFRRSFLITRTVTNREYFSIIAKEGSGIVLANNLMIFINDILQKPVVDYSFNKGTRITFKEAPKRGSKFRMYLYVASRDDYFEVDVDQTVKEGDRLQIQPWDWGNIVGQDQRIIYELLASDTVETQTYSGAGIRTDNLERPVVWTKQKSDTYIDGEVISKSRNYLEPQIMPNTNVIASVAATDTKIYVKNIYPTFSQYDDIATNLNNIRIVGLGTTALDSDNIEKFKAVTYSGDYGQVIGITTAIISSPIVAEQVKFLLTPAPECITDHAKPGIDTGDYFVIQDVFPNVATSITSLGVNTSTTVSVGIGSINTVYQAYAVSVGSSTVEVTCNVQSVNGITTTALPAPYLGATNRNAGSYTWGAIEVSRTAISTSFDFYNQNGLAGIETSAYVSRILPLKTTL